MVKLLVIKNNKMKIAIDISRAVNETAGIARYTASLTKELIKQAKNDEFDLFVTYLRRGKIKEEIIKGITNLPVRSFGVPGKLKEWLWEYSISLPDFWCAKSDVIFASSFLNYH